MSSAEQFGGELGPYLHPGELEFVRDPVREVLGSVVELQKDAEAGVGSSVRPEGPVVHEAVPAEELDPEVVHTGEIRQDDRHTVPAVPQLKDPG